MTGPADAATITASEDDAADLAIACAEVAGVVLRLGPDGRVTLSTPQPPDETVLAELRRHRDRIAVMLAAGAAGRAAMPEHQAAPPDPCPWRPGDPDPLRDGLLAGWRAGQSRRLSALAERLWAVRPKREHGVRELDWRAWEAAAREAASLPSAEWTSWRAAVEPRRPPGRSAGPPIATASRVLETMPHDRPPAGRCRIR